MKKAPVGRFDPSRVIPSSAKYAHIKSSLDTNNKPPAKAPSECRQCLGRLARHALLYLALYVYSAPTLAAGASWGIHMHITKLAPGSTLLPR